MVLTFNNHISMKKIYIIIIVTLITFAISLVMYMTIPFLKLKQLHVIQETTPSDKVGILINRFFAYNHFMYVTKGASFNDISCYGDDGRNHTINIKLNWDNSICITGKEIEMVLHVDSVFFEPKLSYGYGYDLDGEMILEDNPEDEGYYFESLTFFDTNQMNSSDSTFYSITFFKQNSSLLNGPKRYGFGLNVSNIRLLTGNKENGHVFEY